VDTVRQNEQNEERKMPKTQKQCADVQSQTVAGKGIHWLSGQSLL
jgi:hypothetical protein